MKVSHPLPSSLRLHNIRTDWTSRMPGPPPPKGRDEVRSGPPACLGGSSRHLRCLDLGICRKIFVNLMHLYQHAPTGHQLRPIGPKPSRRRDWRVQVQMFRFASFGCWNALELLDISKGSPFCGCFPGVGLCRFNDLKNESSMKLTVTS